MALIETDLASILILNYPFSTFHYTAKLATKGTRFAYLLETDLGYFVLKISDPKRTVETVKGDTAILVYLEQHNFPAPRLLCTRLGEHFLPYHDSFIHIYTYIEGDHPRPSVSFFEKSGWLLARLHNLPVQEYGRVSGYTPLGIVDEARDYLVQALGTDQRPLAGKLLVRLNAFPSFAGLPSGIIHTDPYLVNWVENPSGDLFLIDWDDAGIGIPLLDVGYAVAHLSTYPRNEAQQWGVPVTGEITWREDWARNFLYAYQRIRPLTALERELLPAAIQLSLLAYIWDWDTRRLILENYERMKLLENFCR